MMNTRYILLCLPILGATILGCHSLQFGSQTQASKVMQQKAELKTWLDSGGLSMDEYQRAQQGMPPAHPQPIAGRPPTR